MKNSNRQIQFLPPLKRTRLALPLAGGTGETVSLLFFFSTQTYHDIITVSDPHELERSSASGIKSLFSNSVHSDQRHSHPANVSTTVFLLNLFIDALSSEANSLIRNQQRSTDALIATNLMQLIIRQGPNLCVISCLLNSGQTFKFLA